MQQFVLDDYVNVLSVYLLCVDAVDEASFALRLAIGH
jgi:hypothetical protein